VGIETALKNKARVDNEKPDRTLMEEGKPLQVEDLNLRQLLGRNAR
jgi:hypothetical protein